MPQQKFEISSPDFICPLWQMKSNSDAAYELDVGTGFKLPLHMVLSRMKPTIREHVSGAKLRDAVPPPYREAIAKDVSPDEAYTLVLCAHNPRDVITSTPLRKAFKRLDTPDQERIIVVGSAFTEEAKALAAEYGARIIALHKSFWTDESANQRQL